LRIRKQALLFLKKKKQKNFCKLDRAVSNAGDPVEQKFFASPDGQSFFQKRSAFFP
jgi:hypothetical protein